METGHEERHDQTATITIFAGIFLTIITAAVIGIFHNQCREKSLFVFRELDMRAITGGDTKRFVGGIIIVFYILWVLIAVTGFLVHYVAFNYRTDFAEVTNINKNKNNPKGNIKFEFTVASSFIFEPELQAVSLDPKENEYLINLSKNQHATCDKTHFSASEYFDQKNMRYECHE